MQDSKVRARAAERAGRFYQHGHCVKHDIITGQDLQTPSTVPAKYALKAPWEP